MRGRFPTGPPRASRRRCGIGASPRRGEKASYYSAVCLETGEVEWMELEGNSNGESSVDFGLPGTVAPEARRAAQPDLGQRAGPPGRGGEGVPADAGSEPAADEPPFSRGQALPGYSPDFNADEAIWGWAREEATGNLCLGSRVKVQERVGSFLAGLANRRGEVKRRCRTVLQSRANALLRDFHTDSQHRCKKG